MRSEHMRIFADNYDYFYFLRENPQWQRTLTRHPHLINNFIQEYRKARGKRFVDKLDNFSNMVSMASVIMSS